MAAIERLRIVHLRNLSYVDIALPRGPVWLVGSNGAGKTSVLEGIYLASRGATFRGKRHGPLVERGASGARVDVWVRERDVASTFVWRSDQGLSRGSELTSLRVRLVGSAIQSLVEGDPALRRRFVDWNVFHVERRFGAWRARYRRVAAQRNAWLRSGGQGMAAWDPENARLIRQIGDARGSYFERLLEEWVPLAEVFPRLAGVVPAWRPEIPAGEEPSAVLIRQLAGDVARGYSYLSPARADFAFFKGGYAWMGSRGENKLAGILLQVSAAAVEHHRDGVWPIWLVDDLSAELDGETLSSVMALLQARAEQVFYTSLELSEQLRTFGDPDAVFHVERGTVAPIPHST